MSWIKQRDVKTDAIATRHIKDGAVGTTQIGAGTLSADAAGRAITADDYFDEATAAAKFEDDLFTAVNLESFIEDDAISATVVANKVAANAFTEATVTNAFADDSIIEAKLKTAVGAWDFSASTSVSVPVPTTDSHATTRLYVDAAIAAAVTGQDWKESVRVATTGALAAYTRTGNVILADAAGTINPLDGVTMANGDRLLLKDGAADADNGIYDVINIGTEVDPYELGRSKDADISAEVTAGQTMQVDEGTVSGGHMFVLTTNDPIVLNTTALTYTDITGLYAVTAGDGLGKVLNTINLDLNGLSNAAIDPPADSLAFVDATDGGNKQASVASIVTLLAGYGLGTQNAGFIIDINEVNDAAVDVANDSMALVDADDANRTKKESLADYATAIAGAGLTATAGVLAVNSPTDASAPGSSDSSTAAITIGGSTDVISSGVSDSGTAMVTEAHGRVYQADFKHAIAKGGTQIIAQIDGGFDIDQTTWADITQVDVFRTIQVDASAAWDGGDIAITALWSDGFSGEKSLTATPGSIADSEFACMPGSISRVRNMGASSAGTADVQCGAKLGIQTSSRTPVKVLIVETSTNGVDAGSSIDANGVVTTTAVPNAALDWIVTYQLTNALSDAGHTHAQTGTHAHGSAALTATDAGHVHTVAATHTHTIS